MKYETIIICSKYSKIDSLISSRVKIYDILPDTFPFLNLYMLFKTVYSIKTILKRHHITLIHSMYAFPNIFWVYYTFFPVHIITTRGSDMLIEYTKDFYSDTSFKKKITNKYFRWLTHRAFEKAFFITSTSQKQQSIVKKFISNPLKIKVIRTGIDINYFSEKALAYRKSTNNAITVFSPRGMKDIYNIDLIVRAIHILSEKGININLKMASYPYNSDYNKFINKTVSELKLESRCLLLPLLSQDEMIEEYLSSDIVVMIPKSDGTPVSGIESMVLKVPLIIGDCDYDAEIFNSSTIWKLDNNNEKTLSLKIEEVIANQELANKKKIHAHEVATDNANMLTELSKVEELYQSI